MISSLFPMLPSIIVTIGACGALLLGVFQTKPRTIAFGVILTLILSAYAVWHSGTGVLFGGQFVIDHLTQVLQTMILLIMAVLVGFAHVSHYDIARSAEFYTLLMCATLGMMIVVGATHFLLMFVGLELMSLPVVALIGLPGKAKHIEGAMKYFIMGGVASCLLLFGCSLVYGATGVLGYQTVAQLMSAATTPPMMMAYASVFLLAGIAFKLGTAPFHMWVPDVYEGANAPTVMLLATVSKVATVGLLLRLLMVAMPSVMATWQPLLLAVALASIVLGNVIAVVQTNIRRMLAYSSIAHMGYVLLGVYVGSAVGMDAVVFYVFTYALTSTAMFSGLMLLQHRDGELQAIDSLAGLNNVYPLQALILLLSCFSLAGVPPLFGFMGKFAVFKALIDANHTLVASVAIIFAVVGAYYYIRVIQQMYFESAEDGALMLMGGRLTTILMAVIGFALLAFGLWPNGWL